MIRDKAAITGKVTVRVFGPDGNLKKYDHPLWDRIIPENWKNFFRNTFRLPVGDMTMVNHNIVTDEGDALIVDMLQTTSGRTAVDNANGVIGVGTGYVSELKSTDALVTQTGSNEAMDATYPQAVGAWAAANDNVLRYRSTFEAGDLNATGIDEALLGNGTDTLAYAQISPAVNVTTSDTLQVDWDLTFLGS